jgi:tetratricopeptide (TPR) repeat protein
MEIYRLYISIVGLLLFISIISCSKQTGSEEKLLNSVENIIEQYPDSALNRLNSIFYPEDLSKSLFNKYNLLLVRAKDKCYKEITGDTIIFAVKDYFIRQKDDRNAAYAAFYCARVLHEQKKEEDALKAYETAIDWANKIEDYNLIGLANSNLGLLYREHYLFENGINAYKKAIEMYNKSGNFKNEITTLGLIGDCFLLMNKMDSTFLYYDESIRLADQYKLLNLQSSVRQNKGVAYREKGDYKQAKQLLREALAFSPDSVVHTRIMINIAKVYLAENKTDSAKDYLNQALAMNLHDPMLLMNYHLSLSQVEERDGHFKEALSDYKEFHNYTFKVFSSDKNNKLMELQHQYDFEKLKNEERSVIIKQQSVLLTLSLVLLAACFIGLIFYRRLVRNRNLLIEAEYKIIALQKMAKEMTVEHLEEKQSLRSLILQYADILKKSALIEKDIPESKRKDGEYMQNRFNKIIYGQNNMNWDKLYQVMNQYHDGFYEKVREKYPQLKDMEFRVCCLSCETGFDNMEISIIIDKSIDMVKRLRSDIRKKLGMTAYDHDFYSFLSQKLVD